MEQESSSVLHQTISWSCSKLPFVQKKELLQVQRTLELRRMSIAVAAALPSPRMLGQRVPEGAGTTSDVASHQTCSLQSLSPSPSHDSLLFRQLGSFAMSGDRVHGGVALATCGEAVLNIC